MTFGDRIIQLRKQQKLSQGELGKKIGTSAPIVGRYEREEVKPSIDVALKLAEALGVSLDYLLGRTENVIADKATIQRIEDIENLSPEEKEKVYYFIDMAIRDAKTKKVFGT